jgi:hypothetical protein
MTMDELNDLPVNRRARDLLDGMGEPVDGSSMHVAELALWGIQKGGLEAEPVVVETLRAMLHWTPARCLNFFCERFPDGLPDIPGWEEALDAREFAQMILSETDRKTFIHFPCYLAGD